MGSQRSERRSVPQLVWQSKIPERKHRQLRILVTGGAGFLGSHLCERLLQSACDVLCVDNFFTGAKRNIAHLLDNHSFEQLRQM